MNQLNDLDWQCRLVDRMVKNNPETTIADFLKIVEPDPVPVPPPNIQTNSGR